MRKCVTSAVVLLTAAFLFCAVLVAQTETGQLTGTVTDPTGSAVPAAKVTVKSTATGVTRSVASDSTGSYTITNLLPGAYQVTAEAAGFSTRQDQISVTVGSRVGLDLKLEVGQASTVVSVSESAAQINTETQTVGTTLTTKQIVELPTLTRNPYSLVAIAGNVSSGDASGRGAGVAINGQRAASTNVLLDGSANNDEFGGGVGQQVPLDSVQEYSILTSNFTAEYGRASGGIINVVTKSGTNDFHGTAYEFNRVSRFASNDFNNNANGIDKPIFTRNQFGFSAGGPIIKNKLFFFENTEWIRVRSAAIRTVFVPTPELIAASAPATQQFFQQLGTLRSGLQNLGTFSVGQLRAAGADPCRGLATTTRCAGLSTNFPFFTKYAYSFPSDSGAGTPQNTMELVGRLDYNITDRTQIYGRYALYDRNQFAGSNADSPYAGFDTGVTDYNNNILLSVIHLFSPRLTSQSKLVYNRLNNLQPLGAQPVVPTLYFSGSGTTSILGTNIALPGYLPFSPGSAIPFGGPQNFYQAYEDMSYVRGRHQFRFGGSFNQLRDNRTFGAYQEPVLALGRGGVPAGIENFLAGQLYQFQAAINPQGKYPCGATATADCTVNLPVSAPSFSRSNRFNEFALYAQDAWKVTPRITFNLGVRYEYFGPQHSNNQSLDSNYYYSGSGTVQQQIRSGNVLLTPNSPIGTVYPRDWNNFAPRVGAAWDVFGNGKTSLRGGYGIGYERNFGNVTFNIIQNPPNYAVVSLIAGSDVASIPISTSLAGPLAGTTGSKALPSVSLRAIDPNLSTAYAHFWSGAIEHEFAKGVVGAIEYSGSKGVNLYSIANVNRTGYGNFYLGDACTPGTNGDPGTCTSRLRTTQFTNINQRGNLGFSNYNGVNFRLSMNNVLNSGVQMLANYTYSHAIDNTSSTFSDVSGGQPAANNGYFILGLLDPFRPKLDKGDAEFDIRHRFVLSGIWEVPIMRNSKGVTRTLLQGWQLAPIFTVRTGSPFSIFDCTNAFTYCPRAAFSGIVPRAGESTLVATSTPNTYQYINLAGKSVPFYDPRTGISDVGNFSPGMSGRDVFRAPGLWNLDLGVYKSFGITERVRLQLRAEAYNIFNHANLYVDGSGADVSSVDFVTGYYSGNRNLQLAAKFIF